MKMNYSKREKKVKNNRVRKLKGTKKNRKSGETRIRRRSTNDT
jgi:hypothetical protein